MTDRSSLGDRMKQYEDVSRTYLTRGLPVIIRVDGRHFHSYLKGALKPFDTSFMCAMELVAQDLCKEIQGAVFAYGQSDEVSVLIEDYSTIRTQPWFGKNLQKMVSVAASVATASMHASRGSAGLPMFDARAFVLPNDVEVANYFIWRQRDAVRNSISMVAQSEFGHKELHKVNSDQMQEKLFQEKGINWSTFPENCKNGSVTYRKLDIYETPEGKEYFRESWHTEGAPLFKVTERGQSWLTSVIPQAPKL